MWPSFKPVMTMCLSSFTSCQNLSEQVSLMTTGGSIRGVSQQGKVAYSNIQDNQLHHPLTCWPLWRYQSLGKWPTLATALKRTSNVRSTHLIIDVLLFAFSVLPKETSRHEKAWRSLREEHLGSLWKNKHGTANCRRCQMKQPTGQVRKA